MKSSEILDLKHRLEHAEGLNDDERKTLYADIERFARHDLYGAAYLCDEHLSKEANFRLPSAVVVAHLVQQEFEGNERRSVVPVDLYSERDCQLRQPADRHEYRGPLVGTTPNFLIQRDAETGDLIVHARQALLATSPLTGTEPSISISYPFRAVGGVGLVREGTGEKENQVELDRQALQRHVVEGAMLADKEKEHGQ